MYSKVSLELARVKFSFLVEDEILNDMLITAPELEVHMLVNDSCVWIFISPSEKWQCRRSVTPSTFFILTQKRINSVCVCYSLQSCLTLCYPKSCSPPGSSAHGSPQTRILEWVAVSFFRGPFQPRDRTQVACIAGRFLTVWAVREAHVNSSSIYSSSNNNSSRCFHGTLQFVWFCFEPIYVDSAVCTISYCSV